MEVWKPIVGWPYEASSGGRIRNSKTDRILRLKPHGGGYKSITLCDGVSKRDFYVHRLVCAAFHGPAPFPGAEADHENDVRDDNRASNLQWMKVADNRAKRNCARGERGGMSKLKLPQVEAILRRAVRPSLDRIIAQEFGVSREQIRDIRLRKMWRHVHV